MSKVSYIISAITNLKNWGEYAFHKTERKHRLLNFVTKPTELKISVDAESYFIFKEIFIEDFYDIKTIFNLIPQSPIVVDIGANTGFFEVLMFSKRPQALVYAYEPFASNIALIKQKLDANPQFIPRVKIFEKAVTANAGDQVEIYVDASAEQSAIASIYPTFDSRNVSSFTVSTTNLDEIITQNNLQQIDVLKMDCEGAEYEILYSSPQNVLNKIKLLLLEVHMIDEEEKNIKGIEKFLEKNGFSYTSKQFSNGCYYTYAINKNAK